MLKCVAPLIRHSGLAQQGSNIMNTDICAHLNSTPYSFPVFICLFVNTDWRVLFYRTRWRVKGKQK
jgi:hypothetical protein